MNWVKELKKWTPGSWLGGGEARSPDLQKQRTEFGSPLKMEGVDPWKRER